MPYYKVVEQLSGPIVLNTHTSNYGQTLIDRGIHQRLLDIITQSSAAYDFPLDVYFTLNNNIALWGNDYLRNFPQANNGHYDLGHLCLPENRRTLLMAQNDLVKFVEDIDENKISLFQEGYYLWEYIYEDARKLHFPKLPARHESLFLFENKIDCEYYIKTHGKFGGIICEVELINTKTLFRGDMNILDQVPNHLSYRQTLDEAIKYWSGYNSSRPVYELIFQGTCELKPI